MQLVITECNFTTQKDYLYKLKTQDNNIVYILDDTGYKDLGLKSPITRQHLDSYQEGFSIDAEVGCFNGKYIAIYISKIISTNNSKSTQRFSNRVDNYVKYRPGYPDEVLTFLSEKAHLSDKSVIADVGSGSGIFTQLLLDQGYTVYAVEPNDAMREHAEKELKTYSTFRSVNGTAEETTLANHSADLVVCAQAFHWFNQEQTKVEFKRILKPVGMVALIWNNRQIDIDEFAIAYELLLQQKGSDYKEVNHRNITDVDFINFFRNGKYELAKYSNVQVFDEDGLLGRAFSSSYIPPKDTEAGQVFLADLKELFAQYQTNGTVDFVYQTEVYLGKV